MTNDETENSAVEGVDRIPVGISSCLLGERVRYDGGHKSHSYITQTLGRYFDFRPFCPEVAIGLGVPREPIRLARHSNRQIRCVPLAGGEADYTEALQDCADDQRHWQEQLCGYIVKKDSPSCGMEHVQVWEEGASTRDGEGIFAGRVMENLPYLPVEEEGRLGDPVLRENFIQRVFVLRRWHALIDRGLSVARLDEFHVRHQLILMSRDQLIYRRLGRLVAGITADNIEQQAPLYLNELMQALKLHATRKNQVSVLQHILGYLKRDLQPEDKQELRQVIEKYRQGQVPLIVPLTLMNHFFRKHPNQYIQDSWYMDPHPAELCLQNAI